MYENFYKRVEESLLNVTKYLSLSEISQKTAKFQKQTRENEKLITTTQGSCIKVNWDQNDDLKNITLYNNEEFDNLVPCLINEVPYLK